MSKELSDKIELSAYLEYIHRNNITAIYTKGKTAEQIEDELGSIPDICFESQDVLNEYRQGQFKTQEFFCEDVLSWTRWYEFDFVAAKLHDGSWAGWPFCRGGGKFGEPREFPWLEAAYPLDCVETEKLITVHTFSKIEESHD